MTCPNCTNGMILPAMPHKDFYRIPCPICGGTGTFPDGYVYLPKLGEIIKDILITQKMTLREASRYYDVDATDMSMWKRGIFRNQFEGGE